MTNDNLEKVEKALDKIRDSFFQFNEIETDKVNKNYTDYGYFLAD